MPKSSKIGLIGYSRHMVDEITQTLGTIAEPIPVAEAQALARDLYGFEGSLSRLGGERDSNFKIIRPDGKAFVLKVLHPAEGRQTVEMQIAALQHLDRSIPVQRAVETLSGEDIVEHVTPDGDKRLVWMVGYAAGRMMADAAPAADLRHAFGHVIGQTTLALASFDHAGADRRLLWDLAHAAELKCLITHVSDSGLRQRVRHALARYQSDIEPIFTQLPQQIIHGDFNPHNIVTDELGTRITGVIDLGDMVRTARVADIAVALSYHLGTYGDPWQGANEILDAYTELVKLTPDEREALPYLVETRLAMSVIVSEWRAALHPENRLYIMRHNAGARSRLGCLQESFRK